MEPPPCRLCGGRGYVEIPLAEPGDMMLPRHPKRLRWFLYGASIGLARLEKGQRRAQPRGGPRRGK